MTFRKAVIIFNPKSTGDSVAIARTFKDSLQKRLPRLDIALSATAHAGHAEELAYHCARHHKNVIIISVSGDGGYNEVVNGVLKASSEIKTSAACAVLPGGNANDHYRSVSKQPLEDAIAKGDIDHIDLLRFEVNGHVRYAHSYIGLGLTPRVAIELNRHNLSPFREVWLAAKTFWQLKPFEIQIGGMTQRFDSLVAANIDRMAKHLTLVEKADLHDGMFDAVIWQHTTKLHLLSILGATVFGRGPKASHLKSLDFTCLHNMPIQYDGEVMRLKSGDHVRITAIKNGLQTLR